jgi:catechol 2,3-dioxygenase-like lactoylglutathione lyase family enzyme
MAISGLFPVLLTSDVIAARHFYERCFGLVVLFESDWYVQLSDPTNPRLELAVMTTRHESLPSAAQPPAAGVLLTFEVPDAAAEHARLSGLGVEFVHGLRDEAWGQRHFMLRGHDGVYVDIVERIPPAEEFASGYTDATP